MMHLVLNLTPETESKLREQAARSGKDPESLIVEAIEEKLAFDEIEPAPLPYDQWKAKFDAFLASIPKTNATFVDDSRESIYEGRGE